MRSLVALAISAGLFLGPAAHSQNAPGQNNAASNAPVRVTSVEGITEYRLANGMQVLLFPDPSNAKVTVNVTYLVGSRHEGYGETGMAHLLEHMLFKGTQKHGELGAEIRAHGGDYNGSTSFDRTNYFETLPATDENLKWALEMEADRMVNSKVSRQDLDSEMTVVRNEFERGENNPMRVLEERVMSTAYLWHGYGRSPIGSRSDIEKVPIENLQAFYRKYYQPDNALLVVAGRFNPEQTLGWIQSTFGAIPRPTRKLQPTYTEEPTQDGEREVALRRIGDNQALQIAYHIPAAAHPDMAALNVLAAVLGEQPSGRLYKALVDSKKATNVAAETYELHDPGLFMVEVQLRKENSLEDAEKTTREVIQGVVKEPPSKEEVDRAKTRILKDIELTLNNSQRVGLFLSEYAASGDWRLLFFGRDQVEKITPADVARVAQKYLKPSNMTLGRFIPEAAPDRAEIPPAPDIAAELKDYQGRAVVSEGEAFDPSPMAIEARTTRVTLPGGMKLVLLPKKTRGGTVIASLNLHFGDEKSLNGKSATAQLAGALLMRGTSQHNRQQLQDELDRLKIRMNANGNVDSASVNIDTVRAGIEPALRLAAEVLRTPAFPESELEQVRQQVIGRVEAQRSDPQAIASNEMNRFLMSAYPAGDPRAVLTPDETLAELKKVTLADVKRFHSDFYGASNAELAVVGDFDPAAVQKLATELFGSWKSPAPFSVIKRDWRKLTSVDRVFETPDKQNAIFFAASTVAMDQQDPDYPALFIANYILGGNQSKNRLWDRIREKEGLSYGVASAMAIGAQEKFGIFQAIAIANPQNVSKVETAFKEELTKALNQGFTAEEVDQFKKTFLQEQQVQRSQDQQLVRLLAREAELGRTMAREADLEKKISELTPEQVNAVARKWIDPSAISYFKAGDFKKFASQ
jgi:zinc protease